MRQSFPVCRGSVVFVCVCVRGGGIFDLVVISYYAEPYNRRTGL